MTRLVPFVLSVLLSALAITVDAKSKGDQIRMYQWTSDYCNDMPKGGNIDVKRNECVNIDGRSIRPRIDSDRKKWLDEVNKGDLQCALAIYDEPNCPGTEDAEDIMYLPADIDDCYTSTTQKAIGSVKFFCGPITVKDNITSTRTHTSTGTSWSIGTDDQVTPITHKSTRTSTTTVPRIVSTAIDLAARGAEAASKADVKWVWMKHPWSGSAICYECFTKKRNNYGWVKCYARAHEERNCEKRLVGPGGVPLTTTTTVWTEATTSITESVVGSETQLETTSVFVSATQPLQPRSWHKKVSFKSPWHDDVRMCADAEWESRGKPDTEIRLQEVHLADRKRNCKGWESLDLPPPILQTVTGTDTLTEAVTVTGFTARATITETIYTSVIVSTRTITASPGGGLSATTTYWPTEVTLTTLTPTVITITTLVPEETTTTLYQGVTAADERAAAPSHHDL